MRLLIAVHGFPPTHSAGAERRAERMARWLARSGHQVEVFTVESLTETGFRIQTTDEPDGVRVHRLFYNPGEAPDTFRASYAHAPIADALAQVLAAGRFDLVHLISGYLLGGQVIPIAKAAGLPVAVTLTEYYFMCAQLNLIQPTGALCSGPEDDAKCARCLTMDQRRYRLPEQHAPWAMAAFWAAARVVGFGRAGEEAVAERRQTLQAALAQADLVICPSEFLLDQFRQYGWDVRRFRFERQGLALPEHLPPRQPGSPGRLRLGCLGQIKRHKGTDLLVEAVLRLREAGRDVTLDLWGSETEEPEFVAHLKALSQAQPAIRWNGKYVGGKVWEILAGLDALVIPSRWYENSPNAILEAFHAGVPVVATRLGGMAELVQHEQNGLTFALNDSEDLQRQLARLLDEPALLDRLRAGLPAVKAIDEEMQGLLAQYQTLVTAHHPSSH